MRYYYVNVSYDEDYIITAESEAEAREIAEEECRCSRHDFEVTVEEGETVDEEDE